MSSRTEPTAAPRRRATDPLAPLGRSPADTVEARLKAIACRLFARRGVDGVTIREILDAANVRNFGAVGYYFGSKENLVRRILSDGAQTIDARRGFLLDALESSGDAIGLEAVVDVLVHAVVDLPALQAMNYLCFVLMLSTSHRDLYLATMAGQPNPNFERCMAHLRRLIPTMPPSAANQRLMFMKTGMAAVLARREAALLTRGRTGHYWERDGTLRHYVRSVTAMLAAPYRLEDCAVGPEA